MSSETKSVLDTPDTVTDSKQTSKSAPKAIKRKFNPKNRSDLPEKRTKAKFNEGKVAKLPTTYLLTAILELSTSFTGAEIISKSYYETLISRDGKIAHILTDLEFYYVLTMLVYYRCAMVANHTKSVLIFSLSELKTALENLLIPDALATYVETFGLVKLSSGVSVIPYFRDVENMKLLPGFVRPKSIIKRINRQRRELGNEPYSVRGEWDLAPRLISKFSKSMSRLLKNAVALRKVNFQEVEGRPEFLSVFSVDVGGKIECKSIDGVDQTQCQLGSAYRLRTHEQLLSHGAAFLVLYGSEPIESDVFLSNHFNDAMRNASKTA